ncbi:hypothetical protein ACLMJK_006213 [Lecanora helva]
MSQVPYVNDETEFIIARRDFAIQRQPLGQLRLYRQGQSPNIRGIQGCIASRKLHQGTCILSEGCLFSVQNPNSANEIERARRGLLPQDQLAFDGLSDGGQPNATPLQRFQINGIEMLEQIGREPRPRSGVFLEVSKFNHSCVPNAHLMWNQTSEQATIFAVRDILKTEEIFVSYIREEYVTQAHRREPLRDRGFHCRCRACDLNNPFGQRSDERRGQLSSLDRSIDELEALNEQGHSIDVVAKLIEAFIRLICREELYGTPLATASGRLAEYYYQEFTYPNQVRDTSRAYLETIKRFALSEARRAFAWSLIATGEHSLQTRDCLARIRRIDRLRVT